MAAKRLLTESDAYELLAYLIASSETSMVEPAYYGPRRLIEAAERLALGMLENAESEDRAWLEQFVAETSQMKGLNRRDPARFGQFLQSSSAGIAAELRRRMGLVSQAAERRGDA